MFKKIIFQIKNFISHCIPYWKVGIVDIYESFHYIRWAWYVASLDMQKRYRRTKLGQFWYSLATLISIISLVLIWHLLFNRNISLLFPFLAVSIVTWTFMSGLINEASSIFLSSAGYLTTYPSPKFVFIWMLFFRQLILFGHNSVIIPIAFIYSMQTINFTTILFIPGLLLMSLFSIAFAIPLSLISLRYRDFASITTSFIQVLFYLTPVLWGRNMLSPEHQASWKVKLLLYGNPMSVFMTLFRNPLINSYTPTFLYPLAILEIVIIWMVALYFFGKYKNRIIYWL